MDLAVTKKPANMGPGFGGHFGGGPHWMRGGLGGGFMRMLSERLDATPAQEKVIRDATEEFRDTVSKLRGEGRKTRADVASTFRKGHFDEVLFGEVFARHDRGIEEGPQGVRGHGGAHSRRARRAAARGCSPI